MTIRAVVGFLFSDDRERVVLIRKLRPEMHKGLLNGVGGKIEGNESIAEAQAREFWEETGVLTLPLQWDHYATLNSFEQSVMDPKWRVYYLRMFNTPLLEQVVTKTDEHVVKSYVKQIIHQDDCTPNLKWLVPMALCPALFLARVEDNELYNRKMGFPV